MIRLGLGILILLGVIVYVDMRAVMDLVASTHLLYLLAAVTLYFSMYVIKTLRWRVFLSSQDLHVGLSDALSYYLSSSFFGAFTPGRVGEITRLFGPARENRRYAESLACTAVDKGFDVLLLLVLLVLSSFSPLLEAREVSVLRIIGGIGTASAIAGILWIFALAKRTDGISPTLIRLAPAAWQETLESQPRNFFEASADSLRKRWIPASLLSVLFWVSHVLCHFCLLLALGVSMDIWYFILCLTLAGVVEFVPVTICGLGTREVLLVFLFEKAALSADVAVAFCVLNVFLIYVMTGLFAAAMQLVRKK
jgi:uncharacterized protein (TIRG00374 family)